MNNIKVLIAAHKPYRMPADPMYLPVFVGAALHRPVTGVSAAGASAAESSAAGDPAFHAADIVPAGFQPDDSGDNISAKNPLYCELTALYWGWKNLDCDYMGLAHYRRHFVDRTGGELWDHILSSRQAEELFGRGYQAILPKKRHYVIETLYSHYEHSHHVEDLQVTSGVIQEFYPEYTDAYVEVMQRRSAHMFNMCIMEKPLMDQYCAWLFGVLFLVEERLDISGYTDFDKRVFGRISELLLDVWITKHQIRYTEVPVRNTEGEHFLQKVFTVFRRKFLRRK